MDAETSTTGYAPHPCEPLEPSQPFQSSQPSVTKGLSKIQHVHSIPILRESPTFSTPRYPSSSVRLREALTNKYWGAALASLSAWWTSIAVWHKGSIMAASAVSLVLLATFSSHANQLPDYRIAFIGNSMQYYNDFPRFMRALSDGHIDQDCCLHGDATLTSILNWGSGTYQIWHTGVARIANEEDAVMYDMGACTVPQLLLGYDADLEERMSDYQDENGEYYNDDYHDNADNNNVNNDDFFSYNDGKNPCFQNPTYFWYRQQSYLSNNSTPPEWDFIVLNDRTRSPARASSRNESLEVLESTYLPWFLETGATPVFLVTYGYDTPYRDMSGLVDVPTFTSLTYEGYRQYVEMLSQYLPADQQPRLAPVGLAFLMVWEENRALWEKLFHIDQIHASPHGTFLQGCVVYHTIFGRLPHRNVALRNDMSALWDNARRLQPRKHRRLPMPTREEAEYLYHIADRVVVRKQKPKTFTEYHNGEASNYVPNDSIYADNDIY